MSLTLVLQVFLFIPNNTPVSLKVECNFLTPCVFLNLLVSDEKKEKEKKERDPVGFQGSSFPVWE